MTEDQIKAIAEKYVEQLTLKDVNTEHCPTKEGVIRVLEYLSSRYCIVEREKVEQEYVYACGRSDQGGYYDGKAEVLEELFGTSMFNQDEE